MADTILVATLFISGFCVVSTGLPTGDKYLTSQDRVSRVIVGGIMMMLATMLGVLT